MNLKKMASGNSAGVNKTLENEYSLLDSRLPGEGLRLNYTSEDGLYSCRQGEMKGGMSEE